MIVTAVPTGADLEPIDVAFGDLVARLAGDSDAETLRLTAMLLSRERRGGHACVELERWAGRALDDGDGEPHMPELDVWRAVLDRSPLVGNGDAETPLVLDARGRCYLRRYWQAERAVARRIRELAAREEAPGRSFLDERNAKVLFDSLFAKRAEKARPSRQADAAERVLSRRFAIVSGGPGTGKTTTVARVLALLKATDPALRIEVAAPTGKAAARLTESLRAQAAALPVAVAVRDALGELEARTIHRLLGYGPRGFRHDASRPLACDVVIVDEASMIDLLLMNALLEAIPLHARLALVGDPHQLASVDAGFVFGDLCESARIKGSPLTGSAVELDTNWRFADHPGISALAERIKAGDGDGACGVLSDAATTEATRRELPGDRREIVRALEAELGRVRDADSPEQCVAALAGFRLLAPGNRGPYGVDALNRLVEDHLSDGGRPGTGPWYRGRPVMITVNDYAAGLFNGDVGVCFPDDAGRMRVWFPGTTGTLRAMAPANLPTHVTAWAMTVHKSQGSEFDRVILVLPDRDSPLLSRELVYTAVTRARRSVTIYGSDALLRAAVTRRADRASGLLDAFE